MKEKKYPISVNTKKIDVVAIIEPKNTLKGKNTKVSINLNNITFDNIKEFTYFVNMLTDVAEELRNEEMFGGLKL